MLGPISGREGRWVGQTGGEILSAHVYRNEEKRRCRLLLGLLQFSLVVPPLQLGVMEAYLVRALQ
jgi:hypothetical protein